jgi:hypothetical protein
VLIYIKTNIGRASDTYQTEGACKMTKLTKKDILAVAGSIDDDLAAQILELDPTQEELTEALAWLSANDTLIWGRHHVPHGRIQQLCDLIAAAEIPHNRE